MNRIKTSNHPWFFKIPSTHRAPQEFGKPPISSDLSDFHSWVKDSNSINFNVNALFSFNNELYINAEGFSFQSDTVYRKSGSTWEYFDLLSNETNSSFKVYSDLLLVSQSTAVEVLDKNWNNVRRVFDYQSNITPAPRDAAWDAVNNTLWVADFNQGFG